MRKNQGSRRGDQLGTTIKNERKVLPVLKHSGSSKATHSRFRRKDQGLKNTWVFLNKSVSITVSFTTILTVESASPLRYSNFKVFQQMGSVTAWQGS